MLFHRFRDKTVFEAIETGLLAPVLMAVVVVIGSLFVIIGYEEEYAES
jgi:hypothetical protein